MAILDAFAVLSDRQLFEFSAATTTITGDNTIDLGPTGLDKWATNKPMYAGDWSVKNLVLTVDLLEVIAWPAVSRTLSLRLYSVNNSNKTGGVRVLQPSPTDIKTGDIKTNFYDIYGPPIRLWTVAVPMLFRRYIYWELNVPVTGIEEFDAYIQAHISLDSTQLPSNSYALA